MISICQHRITRSMRGKGIAAKEKRNKRENAIWSLCSVKHCLVLVKLNAVNHILEIINVNINDKQHHYNLILCTNIIIFGIVQHQNLISVSLIQTQLQFIVFNLKITHRDLKDKPHQQVFWKSTHWKTEWSVEWRVRMPRKNICTISQAYNTDIGGNGCYSPDTWNVPCKRGHRIYMYISINS